MQDNPIFQRALTQKKYKFPLARVIEQTTEWKMCDINLLQGIETYENEHNKTVPEMSLHI
jgi:hypothetical protein